MTIKSTLQTLILSSILWVILKGLDLITWVVNIPVALLMILLNLISYLKVLLKEEVLG